MSYAHSAGQRQWKMSIIFKTLQGRHDERPSRPPSLLQHTVQPSRHTNLACIAAADPIALNSSAPNVYENSDMLRNQVPIPMDIWNSHGSTNNQASLAIWDIRKSMLRQHLIPKHIESNWHATLLGMTGSVISVQAKKSVREATLKFGDYLTFCVYWFSITDFFDELLAH